MKIYKKPAKYELNYRTDRKWCWDKCHTTWKKHEFILHANVHCSIYKYCIFEIPEPINVLYAIKQFWGQDSL